MDDRYAGFRKRLTKVIGIEGAKIVRALVEEIARYKNGVDGTRFRIKFKNNLETIDRLTSRFIREDFDPNRTYRPKVLGLAISGIRRANEQLFTIDKVIDHLAAEYEKDSSREITAAELSGSLDVPLEGIYDALCYVRELGVGGGRSSDIPDGPDWYIIPGEPLLQLPNLSAVLEQQTKWAEEDAKATKANAAILAGHSNWITYWQKWFLNWVGQHKMLSLLYVVISAIIVFVLFVLIPVGGIL